jgi:hypothetical protein
MVTMVPCLPSLPQFTCLPWQQWLSLLSCLYWPKRLMRSSDTVGGAPQVGRLGWVRLGQFGLGWERLGQVRLVWIRLGGVVGLGILGRSWLS